MGVGALGESEQNLAARVLDALPQTQCTRCGYPDCKAYARAIAHEQAPINQCPPGGAQGIARLARITGRPVEPLNPAYGTEGPRTLAVIDEAWCIGCTLCIEVCPTDAVLGSNKVMHTIIEPACTGCELCVPVCPVDCISLEVVTQSTGWQAWSQAQADEARSRYAARQQRLAMAHTERTHKHTRELEAKLADPAAHTQPADQAGLDRKKAIIEAALARARARQV
jgi:electron transport complex protein RnfB